MKKVFSTLIGMSLITLLGCDENLVDKKELEEGNDYLCTEEYVSGITVEIQNDDASEFIGCGSTVTINDSGFTEQLVNESGENCNDSDWLYGAGERAGTYDIRVEKEGYLDWSVSNIEVTADACHVKPVHIVAKLQPKPDEYTCTEEYVSGITVEIQNSETGDFIGCGSTVNIEGSDFTEQLVNESGESCNDSAWIYGAGERAGTYDIHIEKEGYLDWSVSNIEVTADTCHVKPVHVVAKLQPKPDEYICTEEYVSGITVGIKNGETGDFIGCGSTVTIEDSGFTEQLDNEPGENCNDSGWFYGAGERAGTYDIRVEKEGYLDWSVSNVEVTADACHVQTVHIEAELQPDTVEVYINTGNTQCNNDGLTLSETMSYLTDEGINVSHSQCGAITGLLFPSVCGGGTGNIYVHTIGTADLVAAENVGFTEASALISEDSGYHVWECL